MKKLYMLLLPFLAIMFLLEPAFVSATNIDTSRTEGISNNGSSTAVDSTVENGRNQIFDNTSDNAFADEPIKKVTTEEVGNRIVNKIYDLITILQRIAEPAAVFMFIISGFFALFGIFSHGGFVMKGIWGMIIAICIYTAVIAAPEIVAYMSTWLMS